MTRAFFRLFHCEWPPTVRHETGWLLKPSNSLYNHCLSTVYGHEGDTRRNLSFCFSKTMLCYSFLQQGREAARSEADMDCGTSPPKRPKLNPHGKALRRERIFERLRGGWSYEAIASEERVTPRRIRQIVSQALRRQEIDGGPDQAMLQLLRLEGALRLAAEAVGAGDIGAIGPYLNVLDRIDRYRRGAAPVEVYNKASRDRLFAKLNQIASRLLAETEPKPLAAEGGSQGAAAAPERSEARPLDSPASP